MVLCFVVAPAFVPDVPYLQIVRSAGLGLITPNTTTRLLCDRPSPVPFKPLSTIRIYLPRSIIETRPNSPQTRPIAAIRARLPACIRINKKRMPVRHPLPVLLYVITTSIYRYLFPILPLVAGYLSRTQLTWICRYLSWYLC